MIATKVIHEKRSVAQPRATSSLMRQVTSLREASPVETFYKQSVPGPHGTQDAVAYRTDIYMLFNQQRLDRMSLSQLTDWLDNQTPTSGLQQLRSKMSDAQLHQYIKSRYIQSPSELRAWSDYLQFEFESEINKLKQQQDVKQDQQVPTDPAASASPAPAVSSE